MPSVEPPMYGRSDAGTADTAAAHQKLETAKATAASTRFLIRFAQPRFVAYTYTRKIAGSAMYP